MFGYIPIKVGLIINLSVKTNFINFRIYNDFFFFKKKELEGTISNFK